MQFPVGLQPYTVRHELDRDYLGTLTRIAEIGYTGVELGAPPAGISLDALKQHLERIGLRMIGAHAPLVQLDAGLDAQIDTIHALGGAFLAISHRFESRQEVIEAAQRFNRIGARCRERGVQFLYHNHDWEFIRFDGTYVLDLLIAATDPELVKFELDTYWVRRGGADPAGYLRRLPGRCPLLHIKDMEPGEEQFFAEIGTGVLDFKAIFAAAAAAGTTWLIVEQDASRRPIFESIAISYRNLQALGVI